MLATMQRGGLPERVDYDVVELASHVALFVPFGILLACALGRRLVWLAVILGVGAARIAEVGPSARRSRPSMLDLS